MATLQKTKDGYILTPDNIGDTQRRERSSSSIDIRRQREIDKLMRFADRKGMKTKAEKAVSDVGKLSGLERVGKALTAFETGDAIYGSLYEDKPFLRTYAVGIAKNFSSAITGQDYRKGDPRKTFKDIMTKEGWRDRPGKIDPVDIAGLAGDIFTDPTTFVGGFIGKGVAKLIKTGAGIGKKIPIAGKAISKTEDITKTLFEPFHKVEKLGEVGKAYRASYDKYVKGTRSNVQDFLDESAKRAQIAVKVAGKVIGKEISATKEAGLTTGNKVVDDIVRELSEIQGVMTKAEVQRGILPKTIPNYVYHLLSPEAMNEIRKGKIDFSELMKQINVRLGAAKPRKISGTIKEINNEMREKIGYNLFEEDYFKAFAKRGMDSLQAIKTYDFLKGTAAKFGKVSDVPILDKFGIKWVASKSPQLKGFVFPEPIVQHLDEVQKILSNDEATNALIRMYDKVLAFWKGSVTGWFPAFHTRNAISGIFNNWLAGLNDPRVYIEAEKVLKGGAGSIKTKGGKVISYDEIRNLLKEYGVVGQTGFLDVANYLQTKINPNLATKIKDLPSRAMGAVENRLRTPLFIDGLKRGLGAEKSAKRVIKYHFDYTPEGLTGFERTIMRRLIPFYTWTRNNIPLQLEQLIMQPGKYSAVFKTQRAAGWEVDDTQILPRWLREKFAIKGEGGYWSGIGLPIEDVTPQITQPLRSFMVALSPLVRTPLEVASDYNNFKERRISEDTYGKQYRNMPDFLKKWLEFKEQKSKGGGMFYTVNPHKKYWLELIGARGLTTALRMSNVNEDRKNLWSLITTITKYNYDIDDLKEYTTNEKKKQLEQALYEAGLLRKFEKYYAPK